MHIPFSYAAACLSISILPTVTAFYPYQPKYEDDDISGNSPQRRAQRTYTPSANNDRRSITLSLRRVPIRRENKYTIVNSNDPTQENSDAIDQDGTDLSYMVAVTMGSSREEYHLLLDSAASNTWVMGQDCKSEACKTHNTFGNGDSDSLKTEDTTFSITYGTGSVSGVIASDTLHIGSLSPSLSFGLATNVSDEFKSYPMDGILGIGRGDNVAGTIESPQVMEVLSTSKLIGAKLYGIHLSRAKDGLNDGELNLGEPNKERYDGDLNYIPTVANQNGFWEIEVSNIGVDGTMLGTEGRSAILDSGTSFILMPEDDAVSLHDLIPGYTQSGETFTVPCDTTKTVQIEFGGKNYNISTADYIGGDLGSGNCKSNIIGRQTFGERQWLLGDVFLKNVYSVFDFDNSQVGFGVKGSEKDAVTSASSGITSATATSIAGVSATAIQSSSASGSADPTAAAQDTPEASRPAKGGGARRASTFISSFTLLVALGLLSMFIDNDP